MAEDLIISKNATKEQKYQSLLPQLEALFMGENDVIANLANGCAALKTTFDFWWVGFYLVKNDELVLGPFQGPVACTRIKKGKGVCGTSWKNATTIVVPNVDEFPGHIACSSASKSEIVVPVFNKAKEVIMVLDVDSEYLNHFDEVDEKYLSQFAQLIKSFA
jgi:L-methionine (R)-S-oxide reductase